MPRPRLVSNGPPPAPIDRGPMLDAETIASRFFTNAVSPKWVRRNVPHKVTLGHSTVRWYEADVVAFVESRRSAA